jgi:prophage regulatory protein
MSEFLTILRLPEVLRRTGLSRPLLYTLMARGDFPKPFKIAERVNGWLSSTIDEWIAERANRASESSDA